MTMLCSCDLLQSFAAELSITHSQSTKRRRARLKAAQVTAATEVRCVLENRATGDSQLSMACGGASGHLGRSLAASWGLSLLKGVPIKHRTLELCVLGVEPGFGRVCTA